MQKNWTSVFAKPAFWLGSAVVGTILFAGVQVKAQLDYASIARGGRLYDNWIKELDLKTPEGNQALWATQTTNTRKGTDTYRCKECHGWDYKGRDGAYGQGSHRTGFGGVLAAKSKTTAALTAALRGATNPNHDFSKWMPESSLGDLSNFLKNGVIDLSRLLNTSGAPLQGDTKAGSAVFVSCINCHGPNGTAMNFGSDTAPEYVGTVAQDNPWEFIHKARMGQPASQMPAMLGVLSNKQIQDLLTHARTLPKK